MEAVMSREGLYEYLENVAAWRQGKAAAYSDDHRNARSVAALMSLGEYVHADASDAVIASLEHFEPDVFIPGEEADRIVARYGFDYFVCDATHEEMLNELIVLCLMDRYQSISEGASDRDASGTLFDFEIKAARDGVELGRYYFERRAGSMPHELEAWVDEASRERVMA
jgi:hypothetical protein